MVITTQKKKKKNGHSEVSMADIDSKIKTQHSLLLGFILYNYLMEICIRLEGFALPPSPPTSFQLYLI